MAGAAREATRVDEPTVARRPVRLVAIVGLLALGLVGSVVGPALPSLRAEFGLTLGEVGLLALVAALGYVVSAFLGGAAADLGDRRRLLLLGAATLALGPAIMAAGPTWAIVLAGTAVYGIGTGLIDGPGNALVNEHSGRQRVGDLNLAHAFFGVGAVIGPLTAGLMLASGLSWRLLLMPGLLAALLTLGLVWRLRLPPIATGRRSARDWRVLRAPGLLLLALVLGLYVGVELMVGTWAYSHLRLSFGAGDAAAGLATALYWGGLTLGRLVMGLIGAHLDPHAVIVANIVGTALALGLLVAAPTLPVAILALGLLGLALANIFPAIVAVVGATYAQSGGLAVGLLGAASGLGGAAFPWLTGLLAERAGLGAALGGGLVLLAIMLAAELAAIVALRRAASPVPVAQP